MDMPFCGTLIFFLLLVTGFAGIGREYFRKKTADLYLERLNRTGIDQIKTDPQNEKIWKWIKKRGYAETFLPDYVVSVKFYKKVMDDLEQQQIISEAEFQNCCLKAAPQFCRKHTGALLEFLYQKGLLFLLFSSTGEPYYVSEDVIKEYEHLFEEE